jgi:hypothetical protein
MSGSSDIHLHLSGKKPSQVIIQFSLHTRIYVYIYVYMCCRSLPCVLSLFIRSPAPRTTSRTSSTASRPSRWAHVQNSNQKTNQGIYGFRVLTWSFKIPFYEAECFTTEAALSDPCSSSLPKPALLLKISNFSELFYLVF